MNRGITKENLLLILPPALAHDPSIMALAEANAEVMAARLAEIDRVRTISNIDGLDEAVLDILARDFKVDWWDPQYSIDEKRRTLKGSWRVHKILGTKAAVETAISAIYPNTRVLEWFEYGGEPYHFQLSINISDDDVDSKRMRRVLERMNFYKSLRSHNDGIHYFMEPETMTVYVWIGCPGLHEAMKTAVNVPELTPPVGEARADVAAGAVGEMVRMSAEIDMNVTAPRGEVAAHTAGMSAGIYQKLVTEVSAHETLG